MKKTALILLALSLVAVPVMAAPGSQPLHREPPQNAGHAPGPATPPRPAPQYGANTSVPPFPAGNLDLGMSAYLGKDTVHLSDKEKKALDMSRDWTKYGPRPVLTRDGKLTYVHGQAMPTIVASPMQVCDIELQAGEKVNEVIVGDSARWMVESGTGGNTVHIFVKPVDIGLETSAIITTDRRVYHLRLVSKEKGFMPYVGFVYSDEMKVALNNRIATQQKEVENRTANLDGRKVDISGLNFAYKVSGKASWKPERVFDDGVKVYIYLPDKTSEMPVVLAKKKGENVMVNYRADGRQLIVDGIYDELSLLLGVGSKREEIRITRK